MVLLKGMEVLGEGVLLSVKVTNNRITNITVIKAGVASLLLLL